jgi:stage III sporulation protein AH
MKKKKIFGAKQIIAAVLLMALGGAVWLNMQYSTAAGGFISTADTSSNKSLGDTKYVATVSDASALQTAADTDFFDETRAERKKSREEALALLEETLKSVDANSDAKTKATEKMAIIAERMEKETAIETLIKAKGFEKTVVVIGDNDVSVVVSADTLLPSQILQIQDAVTTNIQISLENIKIVNKK